MTDSFEFSDRPRWVWVYRFDDAGIFTGSLNFYVAPHTGLPANCTLVKCNPKASQAGIWTGESWKYVADVRGATYWDEQGRPFVMMELAAFPEWAVTEAPPAPEPGHVVLYTAGAWQQVEDRSGQTYYTADGRPQVVPNAYFVLPPDCTFTAPASQWERWDGEQWVTDTDAMKRAALEQATVTRLQLRQQADRQIELLNDAAETGIAAAGDEQRLAAWKKYRVMLSRISLDKAPEVPWPPLPAE
ncbi:tail fiber assembly protein [Serratia marcescens]|uniref:tail fiber assembly protein n=1 Tax=Serratia marcescens TaxID=615 RepID=UPI0018D61854|nr:tail fiber assembly protein [Serratia marcescens]HEJ7189550.1 tail fiber assembly protein [Serratia marcescens]HEJ8127248.1 tail fiber assembly protein [Serratia marcescens]